MPKSRSRRLRPRRRQPNPSRNHNAAEPQPKTESRIAKIATIENHQQNLYNAEVTKYTEEHRGICEKNKISNHLVVRRNTKVLLEILILAVPAILAILQNFASCSNAAASNTINTG